MQTTLRLDDALLKKAKSVAAADGQTLTAFIEEALRIRLSARSAALTTERPSIPVASGDGGLMPGVDLDDSSALIDLMEST